jgi:signal peptidase I
LSAPVEDASKASKDERPRARRSPRHVRAAARVLHREARKILKKHGSRIAAEPAQAMRDSVVAIEALRAEEKWEALEDEAEKLDELLHRHASFARKSPLRETIENIGIAVMIALGLRTCLYEPFKIPSGSMMPTLRAGDHIFVNKFAYGIQLPFTTTVVADVLGEIERGDVIVFRYPLDESEDFIKRVIGLPGDEVQVRGRMVAIKRPGDEDFEVLERTRLEERCYDEDGKKPLANCTLYEESIDGKTYVVRYIVSSDERSDLTPEPRTWKVPEGHLLVMGDNRNRSHDSTQWTVTVEAVGADKLLTTKDLRDLTAEQLYTLDRPSESQDGTAELGDPHHDEIVYFATHRSQGHDLELSVWHEPTLGTAAVYAALAAALPGGKETTFEKVLAGKKKPTGVKREQVLQRGEDIDALTIGKVGDAYQAVARLDDEGTVLALSCGADVCKSGISLVLRLSDVLERFARNHQQDSRSLLPRSRLARYTSEWTGRHDPRDHLFERILGKTEDAAPRDRVRLRAFRHPEESVELVRDAALFGLQHTTETAEAVPELGTDAWMVTTEDAHVFVGVDHARQFVVMLECGRGLCRAPGRALALAKTVTERVPKAAGDRRRMNDLLDADDLEDVVEVPVAKPELYEFDRVRYEATVRGPEHSVEVVLAWRPEDGLKARLESMRAELGDMEPEPAVGDLAWSKTEEGAFTFVVGVPDSGAALLVRCHTGICPERETAVALARRAATKAMDTSTFVEDEAQRPKPFVPRGNVKGRAERIWLPLSRFWLPIR